MGLGSNHKKRSHADYSRPNVGTESNVSSRSAERERLLIEARLRLLNMLLRTINGQTARFAAHRRDMASSQRMIDAQAGRTRRTKNRSLH